MRIAIVSDIHGNLAAFEAAFGQIDAASLATFDYNRDGDVDAGDRTQFNRRLGRTI